MKKWPICRHQSSSWDFASSVTLVVLIHTVLMDRFSCIYCLGEPYDDLARSIQMRFWPFNFMALIYAMGRSASYIIEMCYGLPDLAHSWNVLWVVQPHVSAKCVIGRSTSCIDECAMGHSTSHIIEICYGLFGLMPWQNAPRVIWSHTLQNALCAIWPRASSKCMKDCLAWCVVEWSASQQIWLRYMI